MRILLFSVILFFGVVSCSVHKRFNRALGNSCHLDMEKFSINGTALTYYDSVLSKIRIKASDSLKLYQNFQKGDTLCFIQFTTPEVGAYLKVFSKKIDRTCYVDFTDAVRFHNQIDNFEILDYNYHLIQGKLIDYVYSINIKKSHEEGNKISLSRLPTGFFTFTVLYNEKNKIKAISWQ